MKSNLMKHTFYASLIAILLFSNLGFSQQEEQEEEFDVRKYKTVYKFNSFKQSDNSRLLEVSFIVQNKKDRKDKIPVFEAEIYFYNVLNDEELLVGTVFTSKEGIAKLTLPSSQNYELDENGFINLTARFKGSKGLKSAKKSLAVKDLHLELNLKEIDSVKTVMVEAYTLTLDSLQTKVPLEEADITIFVKGMLSNMPIKEGSIEDGVFEFEFPTNIPGDGDGDVTVIASIEDHDEFGNVTQEKFVNWGSHKTTPVKIVKNTLWSESAPLWMYIVLTILLLGVWANYIYTILNLFKIKKDGENINLATEEQHNKT